MVAIFKPTLDRVIIKKDSSRTASAPVRGVLLPEGADIDPFVHATVIQIGDGRYSELGEWQPTTFENGDRVVVGKTAGLPVILDGEQYHLFRESEIFGYVLDDEVKTTDLEVVAND